MIGTALANTLTVKPDSQSLTAGKPFKLMISYDGEPTSEKPNLRELTHDFEIKKVLTRTDGYNRIDWSIELIPLHGGHVIIPEIIVAKAKSQPFHIEIKKRKQVGTRFGEPLYLGNGSEKDGIIILSEIDNENPYVQEQIILTIRLLTVHAIARNIMEIPTSDSAISKKVSERMMEVDINGRRFHGFEYKFAVFPQISGKFNPDPIRFDLHLIGGSMPHVLLAAIPEELVVRPRPETADGSSWLPAKNLEISEKWIPEKTTVRKGEAISRILNIKAEGLLAAQLPKFKVSEIDGISQYMGATKEQHLFNGINISDSISQSIAIVPSSSGTYIFPAIEIPWWNTVTDKQEIARIPSKTFEVLPVLVDDVQVKKPTVNKKKTGWLSETWLLFTGEKIPEKLIESIEEKTQSLKKNWLSFCLVFLALLIECGIIIAFIKLRKTDKADYEKELKKSKKALKEACDNADGIKAMEALLMWGRARWAGTTLTHAEKVAVLLDSDELKKEIRILSRYVYGKNTKLWNGNALYKIFIASIKKRKCKKKNKQNKLPKLYPF